MANLRIVLLAAFLVSCGAHWDSQETLDELRYISVVDMCTVGAFTHILLNYEPSEGKSMSLHYTQMDKIPSSKRVLVDGVHSTIAARLNVLDSTGTDILVVENAKRDNSGTICVEHETRGCDDLFVIESKNGGESWSAPTPVPRTNMSDSYARFDPAVLHIKETGRVFVFYVMVRGYKNITIGYVSRPKDSLTFSQEKTIFSPRNITGYNVYAAYTWNGHTPIIHLMWYETGPYLFYARSTDFGFTWSEPRKLGPAYERSERFPKAILLANATMSNSLYAIYYKDAMSDTMIMESADHGLTWSKPVSIPFNNVRIPSIKLCETSGRKYILAVGTQSSGNLKFGYYNLTSGNYHNLQAPFKGYSGLYEPQLTCHPIVSGIDVLVVANDGEMPSAHYSEGHFEL